MIHYNLDCDFKVAEPLYADAPFRYTYYAKSDKTVVAEYDGTDYHGCYPMGDMLIVPINARSLGLGEVKVRREYYLTDKDFTDGICNRVTDKVSLGIEIWRGETDGMETHEAKVVPAYQKGDPFTFDDMTDAQKQDIANRVPTKEAEREQAEVTRERNEELRQSNEAIREANETSRKDAEVIREENEKRREETYQQKVDRDDNAPKLTAGFANNLVGRGEATPQEISFRPSGGDTSIEDGTARIERVKGSTLVWNQLMQDANFSSPDGWHVFRGSVVIEEGKAVITGNGTGVAMVYRLDVLKEGEHYYFCHAELCSSKDGYISFGNWRTKSNSIEVYATKRMSVACIKKFSVTNDDSVSRRFTLGLEAATSDDTLEVYNLRCIDLTQMFGAGNEPSTIEEFHARKPLNIDEYAYNEGELISNNVEELKSVGFNAWDEEWEAGEWSIGTGKPLSKENSIRGKNYIRVVEGGTYEFLSKSNTTFGIIFFDSEYQFVSGTTASPSNRVRTIPSGVSYIKFFTSNYGATYKGDLCIHLVHTGYRNGEYEHYKEFRRSIPIKDIKDKDGNQLFPLGLLSAGSVYDEITSSKAIKRIGVLPLSDIEFGFITGDNYYITNPLILANNVVNSLKNTTCSHYLTKMWTEFTAEYRGERNPCLTLYRTKSGLDRVNILDDSVADAAELMAKLKEKNVMLYYELAEPIELDLEEPLNLDYEVSDFGTEEVLSSEPTTPMKADIIYQFNAVDRIRDNSRHTAEGNAKLKELEEAIAGIQSFENRVYKLLLNKTFTEDVASYDVSVDVPNITSYKDFIILIEFKYQEGVNRGGWDFLLLNGDTYPKVSITSNNIATESYRTHYILRLHVGDLADMTAYFEAHNNSFSNAQVNDGNVGINWMRNYFSDSYSKITSFVFGTRFINGEKLMIYAK
jgi:hypothetical protein